MQKNNKFVIFPVNNNLRVNVFKKTKGRCYYCSRKLQNKNHKLSNYMTMDHVIPKDDGGKTEIDNLIPACSKCNSLKKNDSLDTFIKRIQKRPENQFKFCRKLTIGEIIEINGVSVKYLGTDVVGTDINFNSRKKRVRNKA